MIAAAGKYTEVKRASKRPDAARKTPAIFVPTLTNLPQMMEHWYFKALREGGELFDYLVREKHGSRQRFRAVARLMHGRRSPGKSELRLKAAVPAREFFRWQKEEPGCWGDDDFIRRMARSEPDMVAPK